MRSITTIHARLLAWAGLMAGLLLLLPDGCARHPKTLAKEDLEDPYSPKLITTRAVRVHMKDGDLYVLDQWWMSTGTQISGKGRHYDVLRNEPVKGQFAIEFDDIALFEVRNPGVLKPVGPGVLIGTMGLVSAVSLGFTIACIANPKMCWGSCPTFYVPGKDGWKLQAEGFSTSVARSLEDTDLDALPLARAETGAVTLEMRNEALETHVVRWLKLLEVHPPAGTTAWKTPEWDFIALGPLARPQACTSGPEGCLDMLAARDGQDLYLPPSPTDLAARTEIVLTFPPPGKEKAAVAITARNSLLSTFVFYHTLALFGERAGEFVADLERGDPVRLLALWQFNALLGGIEVAVRSPSSDTWKPVGTIPFTGPIACAHTALAFDVEDPGKPLEVRLSFAFSHWKIDNVAAAAVEAGNLAAGVLQPSMVMRMGEKDSDALDSLRGESPLVMLPGDAYQVTFEVGGEDEENAAYFLQSRGYYYEWMREAWLAEEDIEAAERILANPEESLRELAPLYGEFEPGAEEIFRKSRINVQSQ
jgi:hypothetical protein